MNKRFFSFLLALVMLLSVAVCGSAAAQEEEPNYDIDAQLNMICAQVDKLVQSDSTIPWYYTVADLDHDGNLEFIAASQHPGDRSTNLKIWEVSADRTALVECTLSKEEEESFPDILTDCADTFHNLETDVWSYLFYDNIVLSDTEVYTVKTAVSLKDGVVGYEAYAVEHTVVENAHRDVSYTDVHGAAISQQQYDAAGVDAFVGTERSSTSFDWFTESAASNRTRLADSLLVFMGEKEPTETFPVPRPFSEQAQAAATPAPVVTSAPAASPAPAKKAEQPLYLSITKNPTNENRKEGSTALFVACANAFDSLNWTLVAPNGGEYSVANFANLFPGATVTGQYSTTLSIANVSADMHGWGAYCTFAYKGQSARTSTAYIYVEKKSPSTPSPVPVQETGELYGNVTDYGYDTVSFLVPGYDYYTLPRLWCRISGELYVGAPATLYWEGRTARGVNVTSAAIQGSEPIPQPVYGSMNGLAYHDTAFTVYIVLNNGVGYHVDGSRVNIIGGSEIEGASCVAYYADSPSEASIYQVDIYGYEPYVPETVIQPEPVYTPSYGVISGRAFQDIGNSSKAELHLDNGDTVYVDNYSHGGYTCTINGTLVVAGGGNPCRVFYVDYPSAENIYEVQISAAEENVG